MRITKPELPDVLKLLTFTFGLAIIALIYIGVHVSSGPALPAMPDYGDQDGARNAARQFVTRRLLAPATAKFSPDEETPASGGGGRWVVSGYVDAQNVYGALIRQQYSVAMEYTAGQDKPWSLRDVKIAPRI